MPSVYAAMNRVIGGNASLHVEHATDLVFQEAEESDFVSYAKDHLWVGSKSVNIVTVSL